MNDTGTIEVNEEREKALHLQLAFQPGTMADLAVAIVELALKGPGIWPDELDFPLLAEDSTCKGSTYHRLATVGILEKDWAQHRTSKAEAANGRAVFFWRLKDRHLAEVFLRVNRPAGAAAATAEKQEEMAW
jgi:hypothetical protein